MEGRLAALEAQLLQVQTRLGRLSALEQRLELLEKASAGRITIDKHQWENLESRVLLLETRLTLSTATAQVGSVCVSLSTAKGLLDTVCLHVCQPWPR